MSYIHVCLVSDQTIPNILPIAEYKPDELLLISSAAMEKKNKSAHIIASLKNMGLDYSNKFSVLQVIEDSIVDCHRKIDEWSTGRDDAKFIVNLTCGTKIMSIAAYEYFKDYGSKIFYVPIGQNQMVNIFPKRSSNQVYPLNNRIKVLDYLAAYGLQVKNSNKLVQLADDASNRKELAFWMANHYQQIRNILSRLGGALRPHRNTKKPFILKDSFFGATPTELELLNMAGFLVQGDYLEKELVKSEIQFLTGGWLEEFCFNELQPLLGSEIDDLVTGIKIGNPVGTDNEFDLMFTRENALYTVECKSGDQNDDKKADALYKVAALQKDFGLYVNSFFVSTSPYILKDGELKPSLQARAEQFKTTVITPDRVVDFRNVVKNSLK